MSCRFIGLIEPLWQNEAGDRKDANPDHTFRGGQPQPGWLPANPSIKNPVSDCSRPSDLQRIDFLRSGFSRGLWILIELAEISEKTNSMGQEHEYEPPTDHETRPKSLEVRVCLRVIDCFLVGGASF